MKLSNLHNSKNIEFYTASIDGELSLPIIDEISAGFPSPAQDFTESAVDLNKILIKNPSATFYGRVKGDSMQDLGIHNGDLLVIDKSLEPQNGKIAVCYIDGEFTMKKIKIEDDCCWLIPANKNYKALKVTEENDFLIWGIVIHVIKSF